MASSYAPCPECKGTAVVDDPFGSPYCTKCHAKWKSYASWREQVTRKGVKMTPSPPPPAEDDYIASGDMARDVEAVVEIAILESEFATVKRIGHAVVKTAQESVEKGNTAQKTLDAVLICITEEVKTALRKQGKNVD